MMGPRATLLKREVVKRGASAGERERASFGARLSYVNRAFHALDRSA